MKRWYWLIIIVAVAIGTGIYLWHYRSTRRGPNNPTPVQPAVVVNSSLNGRTLVYDIGEEAAFTASPNTFGLDFSNYNAKITQQVGSTDRYQPLRTLKMMNAGQTAITAVVTPSCAIPQPGKPVCLIASQPITFTILVQ